MGYIEAAANYVQAGYSVIPVGALKKPKINWKEYQTRQPTDGEITDMFHDSVGIGVVCGAVSGNLEVIDFDVNEPDHIGLSLGSLFADWSALVERASPGLLDRVAIVATPRPGRHVYYRCESAVDGNRPLAYWPTISGQAKCVIETRGEGGYVLAPEGWPLAHPSGRPYEAISKLSLFDLMPIGIDDRAVLLNAARELSQRPEGANDAPRQSIAASLNAGCRPGDEFNVRASWEEILEPLGWTRVRTRGDGTQEWKRPGTTNTISATIGYGKHDGFYSFSPNAGVEQGRKYNTFSLYAILHWNGDFEEAARQLADLGYTGEMPVINAEWTSGDTAPKRVEVVNDEKPKPRRDVDWHMPGFIENMAEWIESQAFRPQPALAYAASIAMAGALVGRKLTDDNGTVPNLYIIGVAPSGSGKENAQTCISNALHAADAGLLMGPGDFASGSSMEMAVCEKRSLLCLMDEIGQSFRLMLSPRAPSHLAELQKIMLTMYTKSATRYLGKAYADHTRPPRECNRPNLNIYGTTVPESFYGALSTESISNGLIPRMLIVNGDDKNRKINRSVTKTSCPEELLEVIRYWMNYEPGGAFDICNPSPHVARMDSHCRDLIFDYADHNYAKKEYTEVWARAAEKAGKLALIRAWSCDPATPHISDDDLTWAFETVDILSEQLIEQCGEHLHDNVDTACRAAIMKYARRVGEFERGRIGRGIPFDRVVRDRNIYDLVETGELMVRHEIGKSGRTKRIYSVPDSASNN